MRQNGLRQSPPAKVRLANGTIRLQIGNFSPTAVHPGGQAAVARLRPFCPGPAMRRVLAYIDGFNLYHAISELNRPHLKWLDLHALCVDLCGPNESLLGVYYFTAYATSRVGAVGRHKEYIAALEHAGVRCIVGHFKEKFRSCRSCDAKWVGHEEKETDVAIAVQIVADAFTDQYDRAFILSADSDLAPAIKVVRGQFPNKTLNVIAPPGRLSHARDLKPILEITKGRIARCLLPASSSRGDGSMIYTRPQDYDPPA